MPLVVISVAYNLIYINSPAIVYFMQTNYNRSSVVLANQSSMMATKPSPNINTELFPYHVPNIINVIFMLPSSGL